MTRNLRSAIWLSVALILVGVPIPGVLTAAPSSRVVKLTLRNGTTQAITLEGVGCSERLCSRIAVAARAKDDPRIHRIPLDTIAAVTDITKDEALFRFNDGTKRRLSVIHDNQVFYTSTPASASATIDLSQVQAVEFVGSGE